MFTNTTQTPPRQVKQIILRSTYMPCRSTIQLLLGLVEDAGRKLLDSTEDATFFAGAEDLADEGNNVVESVGQSGNDGVDHNMILSKSM